MCRRAPSRRCSSRKLLGTTLALMLALGVGLMWAPSAEAQTCSASGSFTVLPTPSSNIVENTIGKTRLLVNNDSLTSGNVDVAAELCGTTTFHLACTDSACNSPLPAGTLEFTGCTDVVTLLACDGTNCNGITCADGIVDQTVLVTMPAACVPVAATGSVLLVDVGWTAVTPPLSCVDGSFFQRGETGPNDLVTDDPACSPPVSSGAEGSANLLTPAQGCPECQTCNTESGNCDFVAASEPCVDTDQNECTTAGCDGLGACDQNHIPLSSIPCNDATDTECGNPGCLNGVCVSNHFPEPFSTPCTDTDNNECTSAGCDGAGNCDQNHTFAPDSQPCADTDGQTCTTAGCDGLGACDQNHITDCTIEFCGDGIVQPGRGEQCDDGNTNDLDACRNNCTLRVRPIPTLSEWAQLGLALILTAGAGWHLRRRRTLRTD